MKPNTKRRFLLFCAAASVTACSHHQQEPPSFARIEPSEPPIIEAKIDLASLPDFR